MNTAIAKPFGVGIANTKDIFDAIHKKVNWHHKHLNFSLILVQVVIRLDH